MKNFDVYRLMEVDVFGVVVVWLERCLIMMLVVLLCILFSINLSLWDFVNIWLGLFW